MAEMEDFWSGLGALDPPTTNDWWSGLGTLDAPAPIKSKWDSVIDFGGAAVADSWAGVVEFAAPVADPSWDDFSRPLSDGSEWKPFEFEVPAPKISEPVDPLLLPPLQRVRAGLEKMSADDPRRADQEITLDYIARFEAEKKRPISESELARYWASITKGVTAPGVEPPEQQGILGTISRIPKTAIQGVKHGGAAALGSTIAYGLDALGFDEKSEEFRGASRREIDDARRLAAKEALKDSGPIGSVVRRGIGMLGESVVVAAATGPVGLATYYAGNEFASAKADGASDLEAGLQGLIGGVATLAGMRFGSGTGQLAQVASGRAAGHLAKKYGLAQVTRTLSRAVGIEVAQEGTEEIAHYLTEVAFGKKYSDAELLERVGEVIGPSAVAGLVGSGFAVALKRWRADIPEAAKAFEAAAKFAAEHPDKAAELAGSKSPIGRLGFAQATRKAAKTDAYREAFVDALKINQQLSESPDAPAGPEGSFETADKRAPISEGKLQQVQSELRAIRNRSAVSDDTIGSLDVLSAADPRLVADILDEAGVRAASENERLSELRQDYRNLFGNEAAAQSARARLAERRGGDADNLASAKFDQYVQALRDGDYPALAAEASSRGDGDLENGLFQIVQGGAKQFKSVDIDSFLSEAMEGIHGGLSKNQQQATQAEAPAPQQPTPEAAAQETITPIATGERYIGWNLDINGHDSLNTKYPDNEQPMVATEQTRSRRGNFGGPEIHERFVVTGTGRGMWLDERALAPEGVNPKALLNSSQRKASETQSRPELAVRQQPTREAAQEEVAPRAFTVDPNQAAGPGLQGIDTKAIETEFPGAAVAQISPGAWRVSLPTGRHVDVLSVPNIKLKPEVAAKIRKRYSTISDKEWGKVEAVGFFEVASLDGERIPLRSIIALSEGMAADKGVLRHEAVHWARSLGLFTDAEWASLADRYAKGEPDQGAIEERIASGLQRKGLRGTWERIADFFRKIAKSLGFDKFSPDARRVMADPEFWAREPSGRPGEAAALGSRDPAIQRKLANVAITPRERVFLAELDRVATEAGEPSQRADAEVFTQAQARLQADPQKERQSIVDRASRGGQLDDVETQIAKQLFQNEAFEALESGDPTRILEASRLRDAYRATGTEQARAFRQRQDPLNGKTVADATPEERQSAIVDEIYKRPKKQQAERDKAAKNGNVDELKRLDQQWAKRLQKIEAYLNNLGLSLDDLPKIAKDPIATVRARTQINAADASWSDKLYEYWQNLGLLSGLTTQVVNITGNAGSGLWDFVLQRPVEAVANIGGYDPAGARIGELPHIWRGLRRGISEGMRNALVAWKTEMPVTQRSKWDTPDVAIGGQAGRTVRAFGWRLLQTADEFFNSLFANLQVGAEAYRQAKLRGMSGDELAQFIDAEATSRDSLSWRLAKVHAAELTFQNEPTGLAKRARNVGLTIRREIPGLRWFIPFVTFPVNNAALALRKSPITGDIAMATRAYQNWRAGRKITLGMNRYAAERIIAWGAMVALASTLDDEKPWITGSKTNPAGTPKSSILIGDKWYEYGRVEPFATVLNFMVDGLMTFKTGDPGKIAGAPINLTVSQISDKLFLRGLSDLFELGGIGGPQDSDPLDRLSRWSARFGESFVPNIYRQSKEALRPTRSQSRVWGTSTGEKAGMAGQRFMEGIDLPGTTTQSRYDVWGRPIEKGTAPLSTPLTDFAYRLLSPVQNMPVQATVGDRVLARWNAKNANETVRFEPPRPVFTLNGKRHAMTDVEYAEYQQMAGQLADQRVQAYVNRRPEALKNPTQLNIDAIRDLVATARATARARLRPAWAASVQGEE